MCSERSMIWHEKRVRRSLLFSRTHKKPIQLHTLSSPRNNLPRHRARRQTGRKSQVRLISKSKPREQQRISADPIVFIAFPETSTNSPSKRLESNWALCGPMEGALQVAFSIFGPVLPPFWLSPSFPITS